MSTPTLSTPDLVLKPYTSVRQANIDWLNDKKLMQYSEQRHTTHTLSTQQKYLRQFDGNKGHIWQICAVANNEFIGTISATLDKNNHTAEIGILIGSQSKKGYGRQSWEAVLNWLLTLDEVRKVEAGAASTNLAMIKIFKKTGMTFEGEKKNHFMQGNSYVGAVYYGKFGVLK